MSALTRGRASAGWVSAGSGAVVTTGSTGLRLATAVFRAGVVLVGSTLGSRLSLGAGAGRDGSAGSASPKPAEGGVVSFLPLVPVSSLALALLSDVPVAISAPALLVLVSVFC
jgi:hypothetical protein